MILSVLPRSWKFFSANLHAMPVGTADPLAAAARYAADLPDAFDVIHLGLGEDGHTASLPPGNPVGQVTDRAVAWSQPYQGRVRMTLTFPVLAGAREGLFAHRAGHLVTDNGGDQPEAEKHGGESDGINRDEKRDEGLEKIFHELRHADSMGPAPVNAIAAPCAVSPLFRCGRGGNVAPLPP